MDATQVSSACRKRAGGSDAGSRPAEAGGTGLKGLPEQLHPIANRYKGKKERHLRLRDAFQACPRSGQVSEPAVRLEAEFC
jgi:hypothetical protein